MTKLMKDAPRDGTEILAWSEAGNWHQVKWVDTDRDYPWEKIKPARTYWGMRWNPEYRQCGGQFKCWMHMPPAPQY